MIGTRNRLAEQYAAALEEYLADGEETALHSAYELGRQAITDGIGILEILTIHNRSLNSLFTGGFADSHAVQMAERASAFFAESLSPFEMVLRGFRETNTSLRRNLEQIRIAERELLRQNKELASARQTAEAERRRYQELFSFAPDAYLVTDIDTNIQEANTPAVGLLWSGQDNLIGQPLSSFVVPEERESFQSQLVPLQKGEKEKLDFLRVTIRKADHTTITVSLTVGVVRDSQDAVSGLRCLLRDVTERLRLEEVLAQIRIRERLSQEKIKAAQRFKLLAEISTALVSSFDYASIPNIISLLSVPYFGDYCFVYLTDEAMAVRYFAASCTDPKMVGLVRSLPCNPTPVEVPSVVAEVLRKGKIEAFTGVSSNWLNDFYKGTEFRENDNHAHDESALLVPLITHGNPLGAIAFIATGRQHNADDVALAEELARRCTLVIENARLYQQMVIQRDRAEDASQAKEKFVAVLSHELRTPLMVILGWARVLSRKAEVTQDSVIAEGVRSLEHNAQILSRLVEDCLDSARISQGMIRLRTDNIDLNHTAHTAFEIARDLASEKGLQFAEQLSVEALCVSGDPTRMEQVLLNLLMNAIRYTPSGGEVCLRLSRVGSEAEIVVQDTGIGIDPQYLDHIFSPFLQGTKNWLASDSGLGLGLAIAREIVELHGGRIWAESLGQGAGSTFRLRLPLAAVDAPRQEASQRKGTVLPMLKPLRILIVEDSKDILALFVLDLETLGYKVFTATDGELGLEIAKRELPDLIVSDIKMPRCNGYEFIKRIRRIPELTSVPAIAMTGFGAGKDVEEALRFGYNAHLCKPVELPDLVAMIQKLT